MATKPLDPYSKKEFNELAGGNIGQQYLESMRLKKGATSALHSAAESLAGVSGAGKEAYQASKKDTLANLAGEQYRRRRTPIGAALTASEQRRRTAQRGFASQDANMAKTALQEESVASLAKANAFQQERAMGSQAEKDLETMATLQPLVEGWKETYDSMWGADEQGFFDAAWTFAETLPPHMRHQFFEYHIMPQYRSWSGDRSNPFVSHAAPE